MMTPEQAADAIRNSAGQNWCAFIKKDGTRRDMRFQWERVGPVKGTGAPLKNPDQLRVWDPDVGAYRTITCSRLIWLEIAGKREEVRA